ncbi:MAG: hypothetical protein J5W83_13505 [Candidatus Accumulibacter sp.]|uniref:hypothetical protein n=1 Tax=Accumulibacter sp. TaxID=2053492 RepID=UPI001B1A91B2|nr:hypothetical protein [Accumulibacter sp.]MBO3703530.1 hypothetical protein [Accumulibacter sp.]
MADLIATGGKGRVVCIGPLAACEVQQSFKWLLAEITERPQLAESGPQRRMERELKKIGGR